MKVFLRSFAVCLTMLFFICEIGFAATLTADPNPYSITMKKVRLRNSATAEWVTVNEADLTVNIASVNAGELAAGYVSGAAIPEGTYDQLEVTLSTSGAIKASCVDAGNAFGGGAGVTYYTTSAAGGGGSIAASTVVGDYSEGTTTMPAGAPGVSGDLYTDTYALPSIITIAKGSTQKVRVKFDVTGAATFQSTGPGAAIVYPTEPSVEMEIID